MPRIKKKAIDMGDYIPTDEEFEAYRWGVNNGISIAPHAVDYTHWKIAIRINNGKINLSPSTYTKDNIWQEIFKFYVYYYGKRENKI